jgi:tetratricopeptide (TPR) repeat protein
MGVVLYHVGLVEEALAMLERGLAISPTHAIARSHLGFCHYHAGRYREALAITTAVAPTDPVSWVRYQTALCQLRLGQLEAAAETAARMSNEYPILGLVAALRGDAAEADRQIRLTEENRKAFGDFHHAQYEVATTHARLGRVDQAVDWLAAAAANGYPCITLFETDPFLDPLRGTPRFDELLAQVRSEHASYARLWSELQGSISTAAGAAS